MSKKPKLSKAEILKGAGEETAHNWIAHALAIGTPEQKEAQLIVLKHTGVALLASHLFNEVMADGEGKYNNTYLMTHLDAVKEQLLDAVDELAKGFEKGSVKLSEF